ncbi:MAG: IS1634 family transposase [Deferrisomatales bacterium]|nr:IS1634 family transposase [Deferrisomatales bacterium]
MPKRGGSVHVATIKTKGAGDRVYTSYLLRRSYREDGRVRHENLGNLSHLPEAAISAVRRVLAGETLVAAEDRFQVERSLPHGHVAAVLGTLRSLDLERLLSREPCRERDLAVALISQRLLSPGSKLSATRRLAQTTLAQELALGEVGEAELLGAMDWLLLRQERIERALARRHLTPGGFVLYDLSSSYFEGRSCPLAALGHSRDDRRGTLQITYGLICSPEGRPVGVEVFPGNTQDHETLGPAVASVTARFGIGRVIFVGDRGMITHSHAQTLQEQGVGFISALKSPQIRALAASGELQLSLFDECNLAEIHSREFPGERLVVCRNPSVALERRRKREELLRATETELEKVQAMVENPRGRLHHADAGTIGERVGRVSNRYKMAKHFLLQIEDGAFSFARKEERIAKEAALDGLYVLRTTCAQEELGARAVVRAYKQLKVAERAFRQMKSPEIEIRPIYHHLEERVRAHVFLCMLAYYVAFELKGRLGPLLFSDDTPLAPVDPVAPAQRSPGGKAKADSKLTAEGYPAHSFPDLLAELGTLCRNEVLIEPGGHSFTQLTKPNPLQTRAFELLGVRP